MSFASDWSNAKAVHRMEFKKASADIAKQKKLIKKAGSGSKKGAVTIDQIESILDSLEQVSAVKKKKTGLQGSFINIEKILKQMKKMRSAKINPYKGGGKKWKAILKLYSKGVKDIQKNKKKLDKNMSDETKIINVSLSDKYFRKGFPPKNNSCKVLMWEADKIINDINKKGDAVSTYLAECKYPELKDDKKPPKEIVIVHNV